MDIKIATGEKTNKSTTLFLHSCEKNKPLRDVQCNACNNRLKLMSNHFTADNGMRTGFNWSLCMALCMPRLPNVFKV
mgnify:CR=1 FL=1